MTRDEFVKSMWLRGYCSMKGARDYADKHPKDIYTEDDLETAWRVMNPEVMRNAPVKKRCHDEENHFGKSRFYI